MAVSVGSSSESDDRNRPTVIFPFTGCVPVFWRSTRCLPLKPPTCGSSVPGMETTMSGPSGGTAVTVTWPITPAATVLPAASLTCPERIPMV